MGLLKFFAKLDTANKLSDKYGLGAGLFFLEAIDRVEQIKENNNDKNNENTRINSIDPNELNNALNVYDKTFDHFDRLLCYEHKKTIAYLRNELANSNPTTLPLIQKEISKFLYNEVYFMIMNDMALQIKEQIDKFPDDRVPKETKIEVHKLVDDVMKSTLEEESRLKVDKLVEYLLTIGADVRNSIEDVNLDVERYRRENPEGKQ